MTFKNVSFHSCQSEEEILMILKTKQNQTPKA